MLPGNLTAGRRQCDPGKPDAASQLRVTAVNVPGSDFVNDSSYATMDGVLRNRITNIRRPSVRAAFETRF